MHIRFAVALFTLNTILHDNNTMATFLPFSSIEWRLLASQAIVNSLFAISFPSAFAYSPLTSQDISFSLASYFLHPRHYPLALVVCAQAALPTWCTFLAFSGIDTSANDIEYQQSVLHVQMSCHLIRNFNRSFYITFQSAVAEFVVDISNYIFKFKILCGKLAKSTLQVVNWSTKVLN